MYLKKMMIKRKIIKPLGIVNLAPETSPVKTFEVFYLSSDFIKIKKKGHFGQCIRLLTLLKKCLSFNH